MGSRARNSSGRKAASPHARKGKRRTVRRKPAQPRRPDFDAILAELSDALSIITTAIAALAAVEQLEGTASAGDVGNEIVTLEHGVAKFKRGYDALDVALREVRQ